MGWGGFLDKFISKLPIQDRKERIKNKITSLELEREKLVKETWDAKKGKRLGDINTELVVLREQLKNFS